MLAIDGPGLGALHTCCGTQRLQRRSVRRKRQAAHCAVGAASTAVGSHTQKGTVRKQNEDRFATVASLPLSTGGTAAYYAVFDGHGGAATAEWLQKNLAGVLSAQFDTRDPEKSITNAFLAADETLLQPQGFLGSGGRGIGGPKCGSTGLVALCYNGQLVVANIGDARAVLVTSEGEAQQLSIDHVPDNEEERYRIELRNPNPKMPLVRFVGSTWRVGGLLALSRAFGDAYVKASGDFEGYGTANDDYGSGFGVIAVPHVAQLPIPQTSGKTGRPPVLVLSSDGLYANDERGGGGGLTNDRVAEMVAALPPAPDAAALASLAQRLAEEAVEKGTTDDVTVMCIRLA